MLLTYYVIYFQFKNSSNKYTKQPELASDFITKLFGYLVCGIRVNLPFLFRTNRTQKLPVKRRKSLSYIVFRYICVFHPVFF